VGIYPLDKKGGKNNSSVLSASKLTLYSFRTQDLKLSQAQQLKLIDRLRATRWTPPDYWQTDNSSGLVMVIRNCHWLNSTSWVLLISTCSAPLVQTGERKQFSLFDLDLWPTILTYNPSITKVKVDPHAKNQGQGQTVQTGMCQQQTDTHAHTRTNGQTHTRTPPNVLSSLLMQSITKALTVLQVNVLLSVSQQLQ